LADRRAAAGRQLPVTLPGVDEEVWRYSRVDELDLDDFEPLVDPGVRPAGDLPLGVTTVLDTISSRAGLVVTRNGSVVLVELDDAVSAQGVRLGLASELDGSESI